ncbi:hypothetical protein GCM10010421_12760 [Streptomyces glaucus]|uniref:Uncharacterized protein n=1 Tax=Streptomyces glaucus TaxID=284029 RepID=A0ABP5WH03_9ACTN
MDLLAGAEQAGVVLLGLGRVDAVCVSEQGHGWFPPLMGLDGEALAAVTSMIFVFGTARPGPAVTGVPQT